MVAAESEVVILTNPTCYIYNIHEQHLLTEVVEVWVESDVFGVGAFYRLGRSA